MLLSSQNSYTFVEHFFFFSLSVSLSFDLNFLSLSVYGCVCVSGFFFFFKLVLVVSRFKKIVASFIYVLRLRFFFILAIILFKVFCLKMLYLFDLFFLWCSFLQMLLWFPKKKNVLPDFIANFCIIVYIHLVSIIFCLRILMMKFLFLFISFPFFDFVIHFKRGENVLYVFTVWMLN